MGYHGNSIFQEHVTWISIQTSKLQSEYHYHDISYHQELEKQIVQPCSTWRQVLLSGILGDAMGEWEMLTRDSPRTPC